MAMHPTTLPSPIVFDLVGQNDVLIRVFAAFVFAWRMNRLDSHFRVPSVVWLRALP